MLRLIGNMNARYRLLAIAVAALLVVGLAYAALSGGDKTKKQASASAPVAGQTGPTGSTQLPPVSPCEATQLQAGVNMQSGVVTTTGGALLVNVSATPCSLRGIPTVTMADPAGKPLGVQSAPTGDGGYLVVLYANRGNSAFLPLNWANWCAPKISTFQLQIALPGNHGTVIANTDAKAPVQSPRCSVKNAPSAVTVMAFRK